MKKILLFSIMEALKSRPALLRKVKLMIVVGLVGLVVVTSFTLWAGISVVRSVVVSATQAEFWPQAQHRIERLKIELQHTKLQPINCVEEAQSLLSVRPWLERPVVDNIRNLKIACLKSKSEACELGSCENIKKLFNTDDGRTI